MGTNSYLSAEENKTKNNELVISIKNIDLNMEKEKRFLLTNENKFLQPCKIEETDDECIFHFNLNNTILFSEAKSLKLEDKYRLLINISGMQELEEDYIVNLEPENLVYDMNLIPKMLIRDKKKELENNIFFEQYKALASSLLFEKYSYKDYYTEKAVLPKKSFLKTTNDVESIRNELYKRYEKESEQNKNQKILVKKKTITKLRFGIPVTFLICTTMLLYSYYINIFRVPYQQKVLKAYGSYLHSDYISVEDTLKDIKVNRFPLEVKYILARSYIFTEGLTPTQRENLLEYTGLNIDPNIFDFWIYVGRRDFNKAEDVAKRIGNNELLLFTYIKQNAYVKADVTLAGEKKAELIKQLDDKIKQLNELMNPKEETESTSEAETMDTTESENIVETTNTVETTSTEATK